MFDNYIGPAMVMAVFAVTVFFGFMMIAPQADFAALIARF